MQLFDIVEKKGSNDEKMATARTLSGQAGLKPPRARFLLVSE